MGEGALASARGFAGVLTAKLRRAIVWELRTLTPPAVSSSPGQRDYQPSSKLGRCDRIPCCPLLGAFSWFCCRGSDLLQKEVRTLFNCSSKIQQLIQQNFRALAMCISQQSCCGGLTTSSHQYSERCRFPEWREYCLSAHCTLYALCN